MIDTKRSALLPSEPGGHFQEMPRRRLQTGNLYADGAWWRVRWYEDIRGDDGKITKYRRSAVVGQCTGPSKIPKKEALRRAAELLSPVNAKAYVPQSIMTVEQFITQHFEPEVVWAKKHSGKLHYAYCFTKIIPALGKVPLRDLELSMLQRLCHGLIRSGLSITTATHVKVAISAIVEHAKRLKMFVGDNPAHYVTLPENNKKKKPALSFEQAQKVLTLLQEPYRTMALLSMTTSLRTAEMCGLRWRRMNLSSKPVVMDDMILPPWSFAVVENFYRGVEGTVKTQASRRIQPIPQAAIEYLMELRRTSPYNGPEDLVFASSVGTPVDAHNAAKRYLKPAGKAAGCPSLSWHSFRRTAATLTGVLNMPKGDRVALMGHAASGMTDYYSDSDIMRRREYVDQLGERITQNGN